MNGASDYLEFGGGRYVELFDVQLLVSFCFASVNTSSDQFIALKQFQDGKNK